MKREDEKRNQLNNGVVKQKKFAIQSVLKPR